MVYWGIQHWLQKTNSLPPKISSSLFKSPLLEHISLYQGYRAMAIRVVEFSNWGKNLGRFLLKNQRTQKKMFLF